MPDTTAHYSRPRYVRDILLTAVVYFILARLSLLLQFSASNATPVWPPSGFALAIVLLFGLRVLPGILLGAFAVNVFIFLSNKTAEAPMAILLSFFISIGNSCEAMAGYYLLKKNVSGAGFNNFFLRTNHIFRFLFTVLAICMISSTVGVTSVFLSRIITSAEYPLTWATWWLGDVSGMLLVTPFIMIWTRSDPTQKFILRPTWQGIIEVAVLLLVAVLVSGIIFDNWFFSFFMSRWAFWMIPVMVWIALRCNQRETITAIVICSILAIWGTLGGHGPFSVDSLNESLLIVQTFVSINMITTLALNASVIEGRQTEERLREAGNLLESRVNERTAELKTVADELAQKNRELQNINNELASFSYIASHDLQEPLRKIQMFARLIADKELENLSGRSKDYFARIGQAAARMQNLIVDLLTWSRSGTSGNPLEKTDLNNILNEVREELKEKITATNTVIESSRLPEVKVIPFQFRQLFTNIISNSIKFSKPDVAPFICITSNVTDGIEANGIDEKPGKAYHHLVIADNGIGFNPEFDMQVFGLFQRLHGRNEYEGTGIGLAICKKIMENHHGFIAAHGEPDKGATFHVYLPVSE